MNLNRQVQPVIQPISHINWLHHQQIRLQNGSPVYLLNGTQNELIKIEWVFVAGNKYQQKPLSGSFTSTLLKEGTKNLSGKEFNENIDYYGAFLQVDSDRDFVSVTLYSLVKYLDQLLPMVSEMITSPAFPADILEVKTRNAQQQFMVDMGKVAYVSRRELTQQIMGADHYYGKMAIAEDYERLTAKDVADFHYQNFFCQPAKIFVSGHIDNKIEKQLATYFGGINYTSTRDFTHKDITPSTGMSRIKLENTLQSSIRYGKPAIQSSHPDAVALDTSIMLLGGYFGSRLMKNLREDKGFTYGIHAGVLPLQETAMMTIGTELGNEHVEQAIDEINKELNLLSEITCTTDELNTVKNYMAGQLVKEADGAMAQADLLRYRIMNNLPENYHQELLNELNLVTPKSINEMAQKYLQAESFAVVIAG